MKVDKPLVDRIAKLSKLEFDDKAAEEIISDLDKILGFVDKLNELDTENVEPLIYITDETNVLRKDEKRAEITKQDALKNAPAKDSDYFKVPKVLKNPGNE